MSTSSTDAKILTTEGVIHAYMSNDEEGCVEATTENTDAGSFRESNVMPNVATSVYDSDI